MDIPASSAYRCSMFARLVTMLAVIAFAALASVSSVHAAGVTADQDHAVHVGATIQATDNVQHSCDDEQPCGDSAAEACAFVCAGLAAVLPSPGDRAARGYALASHDLPREASRASLAPNRTERPPRPRFL